jgi:hypothetical protein
MINFLEISEKYTNPDYFQKHYHKPSLVMQTDHSDKANSGKLGRR